MHERSLIDTAGLMVAHGKGLLAMDESTATCNQRFSDLGIAATPAVRRAFRELLLTAPGLSASISGVILYDETIRQAQSDGTPFIRVASDAGLLIGIKVDVGAKALAAHAGETVTEGLDGLRERLQAYHEMGARFAKWRAVITIDDVHRPTVACVDANSHALARYAALCQEAGLVPIVEAEVLMNGNHSQARCAIVTEVMLRSVFSQLALQGVLLEAMILKPNMVIAGLDCIHQNSADEVADATLQCLKRVVPAAVAGITFLSGGQSGELASARLNAMHATPGPPSPARHSTQVPPGNTALPWPLSFSFARAIQHPALGIWAGQDANRVAAQQALLHRARCNHAAVRGEYGPAMEET